jgi:hypothetical protein
MQAGDLAPFSLPAAATVLLRFAGALTLPLLVAGGAVAVFVYWHLWQLAGHRHPTPAKPAKARACPRCGYDLTGNVSGVCSECGGLGIPRVRWTSAERQAVGLFVGSIIAVASLAFIFLSATSAEVKMACVLMITAAARVGCRQIGPVLRRALRRM